MKVIYNISIHLLSVLLHCLAPVMAKARAMVDGRRGQDFKDPNPTVRPTICIHCASLGEFEQGRPLIEALRSAHPQARLVLTFFSPSGYEIRKNYSGVDSVYYLPFDTPGATRRFIDDLHPDILFLIKYEFWYNLLNAAHRSGCRIYLVSAIFREGQSFFKPSWLGGSFFRNILHLFDRLFVQDIPSAALLSSIGLTDKVTVAGDTRFDRVASLTTSSPDIAPIAQFVGHTPTIVCGSTWGPDEALIIQAMKAHPEWKFIIAPHEISEERIDRLIEESGRESIKYSQIDTAQGGETLLVVNTIGILSSIYRYGMVSYIGGGFGVGIHNTLEAAAWGKPVVFGPKYQKFQEAVALIECGAATCIHNATELNSTFETMMAHGAQSGALACEFVKSHIGATSKIMSFDL
ncbi:MAG: glycosyltransferase N-terminal domain-containing protein [Mucinivorans sp.]